MGDVCRIEVEGNRRAATVDATTLLAILYFIAQTTSCSFWVKKERDLLVV